MRNQHHMLRVLGCATALIALAWGTRTMAMGRPPRKGTLSTLSAHYNLEPPVPRGDTVVIHDPRATMVFRPGSRKMVINGSLIMLNAPLTGTGPDATLAPADIQGTLTPLLDARNVIRRHGARSVFLDAGHGGSDPGAGNGTRMQEKEVTLDLARRCKRLLEAEGITVYMARDRDKAVALPSRPVLAKKAGADLFVSIHINASGNAAATGVETHILPSAGFPCTAPSKLATRASAGNRYDAMNVLLGYAVHRAVISETRAADRGLRRSRFLVLRDAPCPAILVECGFLSNKREARSLADTGYRQHLAEGIARGITEVIAD
jgi:N-acetylmuramoyl-L-alanine amidase